MKNPYYMIWADALWAYKRVNTTKGEWRFYSMLFMILGQLMNLFTLLIGLSLLGIDINIYLNLKLFPGEILNNAFNTIVTIFFPLFLLNYYFIYRKGKYLVIMERYKNRNGVLFLSYIFISLGIVVIPIVGGFILYRLGLI
jgi:hypothetical protein